MYISTGAPVIQHQLLFSFINLDQIYIQANFNEIDLRHVHDGDTQIQMVAQNENNWIMLPQRLPVQIRITDYDAVNYPLSIGSSAYVYIKTKH